MRAELFLAWRYLRPKRNEVSIITLISIVGVMLGVAVLIVVLAVMTGFSTEIQKKMLSSQQHLTIDNKYYSTIPDPAQVIDIVEKNGGKAAPMISQGVMVQIGKNFDQRVVLGIEPEKFAAQMPLKDVLKAGSFDLNPGEVVLSSYLAERYRVRIGSRLLIHSSAQIADMVNISESGAISIKNTREVMLPMEFTVAGIYHFGKSDFDAKFMFMNLNDAAELFRLPWNSATQVVAWVDDPLQIEKTTAVIAPLLADYRLTTWKDANQQLLSAVNTEKHMMFFLLIFIVLVAAFSISNNLITSVYQKTREIGLLKALGASNAQMMRIFLFQGLLIGIVGTCCGTLMGWLVIHFRMAIMNFTARVFNVELFPKELYYLDELPAQIMQNDLLWIISISIVLCTLGGLIPAWRAAKLDPAQAFRYE